jgi:transcriptional regulator with XRE-family HTH domain
MPALRSSARRDTLPAQKKPEAPAEVPAHVALGVRVRELRLLRGLTLAEVAERAGFGKAYLSRIENGRKVPPIGTLARIATVLDVEAASLLATQPARGAWRGVSIVRKNEKRPTVLGGSAFGYDYLALTNSTEHRALQPFLFSFPDKVDKYVFFEHEGEEVMHILTGRVEWQVGVDKFLLEAGDTLHFDSRIPHRGHSLAGPATALVIIYSPVHSSDSVA